jgi:hypothetical protein
MMKASTTTRDLSKLLDRLTHLGDVRSSVAKMAAPEIDALIREGFESQRDPNRRRWKRRKGGRRSGTHPILNKTGRTMHSAKAQAIGDGINMDVTSAVAVFHQKGTRKMVARPMVPDSKLPPNYRSAITRATADFVQEVFG